MGDELAIAREWMKQKGWRPQPFQEAAWQVLSEGGEGIVNAPTGSGKTYSLLLPFLAKFAGKKSAPEGLRLIWITPIRALSKEIQLAATRGDSKTSTCQ